MSAALSPQRMPTLPSSSTTPTADTDNLPEEVTQILSSLSSKSHLERERAVTKFRSVLFSSKLSLTQWNTLKDYFLSQLTDENQAWYSLHATVCATCHLLNHSSSTCFIESILPSVPFLVSHHEARVRESSISLIQSLSRGAQQQVWDVLHPMLQKRADETFALDVKQRSEEAARIAARDVKNDAAANAKQSRNMLHETEGWRGLETTLLAQASLARHTTPYCLNGIQELLQCAERARPHPNRFVREAGLGLIDAVAVAAAADAKATTKSNDDCENSSTILIEVTKISLPSLRSGLQDNWSQVRFAASVASRTILLSLSESSRELLLFPTLLPRLCLNRHYVAEGVRSYSHTTWRLLFTNTPNGGRKWLIKLLPDVVSFFTSQTRADNHAVREAACQSLGEIALRLDSSVMTKHAVSIAQALRDGFKDESWPVRDHACNALSEVIQKFAQTVAESCDMNELKTLFIRHLSDNIASVRRNCAEGFIRASMAYSSDPDAVLHVSIMKTIITEHLNEIENQPERSFSVTKDTQYGASTKLATMHIHNDDEAHTTNQTMYSCGSLAPKLRRGGGCSDHGFVRPKEPWEVAEGGILLWQALARENSELAQELFREIINCGVRTMKKQFRARSKLLLTWLQAVCESVDKHGMHFNTKDEDDNNKCEMLQNVVRVVVFCERADEPNGVRQSSKECRRLVMRTVGFRKWTDTEKEIKNCTSSS